MKRPLRVFFFWLLALILALGSAIYQRVTGPTYPVRGETELAGSKIVYRFQRSHGGTDDQLVAVGVYDADIDGVLYYRPFKSEIPFKRVAMNRISMNFQLNKDTIEVEDNPPYRLIAYLPHQPPAAKLEYYVEISKGSEKAHLPDNRSIVTRFKGAVPAKALTPHIIIIFLAMFLAARTGIAAMAGEKTLFPTIVTTILVLVGGMILGPIVQNYAFGAYWTGIPFGWDLTDNKTLVAFVGWLIALAAHRFSKNPRWWVLGAALLMLIVFIIPHSMMGSELDHTTGEIKVG